MEHLCAITIFDFGVRFNETAWLWMKFGSVSTNSSWDAEHLGLSPAELVRKLFVLHSHRLQNGSLVWLRESPNGIEIAKHDGGPPHSGDWFFISESTPAPSSNVLAEAARKYVNDYRKRVGRGPVPNSYTEEDLIEEAIVIGGKNWNKS